MSASSDKLKTMSITDLIFSLLVIIVVHYLLHQHLQLIPSFLGFTLVVCWITKSPSPVTKSLALSCSMKTLPIAMTSGGSQLF